MYAFSNSLLEPVGEYKVETFNMQVFDYDVSINIDLQIFGEKDCEMYMADFEIIRPDGSTTSGSCMNRPTKEETFLAVEEAIIRILNDENSYWEQPTSGEFKVIFKDEDTSE